ncbi:MAG: hypothetical protein KBS45_00970 [Clostridiales bacterium]|nr:hypothetical protein [Candidatus Coliplasma caballi]
MANRNVAFVKQSATFVSETQVCNLKCTVCIPDEKELIEAMNEMSKTPANVA